MRKWMSDHNGNTNKREKQLGFVYNRVKRYNRIIIKVSMDRNTILRVYSSCPDLSNHFKSEF